MAGGDERQARSGKPQAGRPPRPGGRSSPRRSAGAPDGGPVGLVLAGAGARGGYEAGVLSELIPELGRRGERPSLYIGASLGALNAALLASTQHLSAEDQAAHLVETWRGMRMRRVMRPIAARAAPVTALRYGGQLLAVPGVRLPGVLDATPLRRNLPRWIDFDRLHANIRDGTVATVGIAATSARTGRTAIFCEAAAEARLHRSHAIAYVSAELEPAHIAASAAMPVLWPPVRIERPERARGWYVDGGTRLRSPIKPALDLGAGRLAVVAVDAIAGPVMDPAHPADREHPPDIGDGILHLMEGALVDPLLEDMRKLGSVNEFFASGQVLGAHLYRTVRGKTPYRRIPYIFVGPDRRGAIGALAAEVYSRRYGGLRGLRSPDIVLLNALLGGESETHGELLSLFLFDEEFIHELVELGRRDARTWLDAPHDEAGPWQAGPLHAFVRPRAWTAG